MNSETGLPKCEGKERERADKNIYRTVKNQKLKSILKKEKKKNISSVTQNM